MTPSDAYTSSALSRPQLDARAAIAIATLLVLFQAFVLASSTSTTATPALTPPDAKLRLNPNVATASELQLLPRIGPKLAQNIIDYRKYTAMSPAFRTLDDLQNVPRIGPITAERLRPFLLFPSDAHAASASENEQ